MRTQRNTQRYDCDDDFPPNTVVRAPRWMDVRCRHNRMEAARLHTSGNRKYPYGDVPPGAPVRPIWGRPEIFGFPDGQYYYYYYYSRVCYNTVIMNLHYPHAFQGRGWGWTEYCRDQTLAAAGFGVTGSIRCGGTAGSTVTCDRAIRSGGCDTISRRRVSGGGRYGVCTSVTSGGGRGDR